MAVTREFIGCICVVLFAGGTHLFNEYRIFSTWSEVAHLKTESERTRIAYAELQSQFKEFQANYGTQAQRLKDVSTIQKTMSEGNRFFFSATRKSDYKATSTTITYDAVIISNNEDSMNAKTGVFTVPINGTYVFSFQGLPNAESGGRVHLILNQAYLTSGYVMSQNSLSMSSLVKLKVGDQVSVLLFGGELRDSCDRFYTQFSGFLLS